MPIADDEYFNLQSALDGKSATGHTHTIGDTSGLQSALDGKSATGHTHIIGDTSGLQSALDGKSAIGHTHIIGDTSGLQSALDGKSAIGHTHIIGDTSGLQSALDGKSAIGHTHIIGDTSGLQSALDGKSAIGHTHIIGDTSGLQSALDGKQATITDSGWVSVTYAANFADWTDASYTPVAYRKIGSLVHLRGLCKNSVTGAGQTVLTLPVGYRPPKNLILCAYSSIGFVELRIYSTGAVVINSNLTSANGWTSLTCLFFI